MLAGKQLDGAPSVLFDAVAIIATTDGAAALAPSPPARGFVSDAYAHCKFIAYTSGAAPLQQSAGLRSDAPPGGGLISLDDHKAADFLAGPNTLVTSRKPDDLPAFCAAFTQVFSRQSQSA
jgi:catalase